MTDTVSHQVFPVPACLWKAHKDVMAYEFQDEGSQRWAQGCKESCEKAMKCQSCLEDIRTWAYGVETLCERIIADSNAQHLHPVMQKYRDSLHNYCYESYPNDLLQMHNYIMTYEETPGFWSISTHPDIGSWLDRSRELAVIMVLDDISDQELYEWGWLLWSMFLYIRDSTETQEHAVALKKFLHAHLIE